MHEQWGAELEVVIRVLETALAPAFLLAAIASLLNVLTSRLARIVDRSRELQMHFVDADQGQRTALRAELLTIARRKKLCRLSMLLAVLGAIIICLMVALLFLMGLSQFSMASLVISMFALAMGLIAGSLVTLFLETSLAAHEIGLSPYLLADDIAISD